MKIAVTCLLLTTFVTTGCGERQTGPHESERGQITYWEVTGSSMDFDRCTDENQWQEKVKPPEFADNTFLVYRLSDDGREAVDQDCETTLPSSCQDGEPELVWKVDGAVFSYSREGEAKEVMGYNCDLGSKEAWRVEDKGETAEFSMELSFVLVGDTAPCEQMEQDVRQDAPNGEGLANCKVVLDVDLAYYPTDFPVIRAVTGQRD